MRVKGVRVALVAYTTGSNGLVPEDYSLNVASEPRRCWPTPAPRARPAPT